MYRLDKNLKILYFLNIMEEDEETTKFFNSLPITLKDLKKITTVKKDVCDKIKDDYELCRKENEDDFHKCIKLFDLMIKSNYLSKED